MARKKLPLKVVRAVNQYTERLRQDNLPIDRIIVFGSYAKGTAHAGSDIDVCVISPRFGNNWQALQYLWSQRTTDSGLTIEPIGFTARDLRDETELTREIKRTGVTMSKIN